MSRSTVSIPPILQAMLFLQALHPRYKAIIYLFASKQKDISAASIDSIILDAQFMDELSFFHSNGNPDPATDDPLDTVYPHELSQVESINDEYPPAQYDPPVDGINPTWIHQWGIICRIARRTILFQSALDNGLSLFSCFQGFLGFCHVLAFPGWLESTQIGFSCSFLLDARMGVLVCPWSAREA